MGLLRLFLAICVVLSHSGLHVVGVEGLLSVLAFFIISGFYMGLVLNEKYHDNIRGFYAARALRLWPAYIVVLLLTALFIPLRISGDSWLLSLYTHAVTFTGVGFETLYWFGFNSSGAAQWIYNTKTSTVVPVAYGTHMLHMWSVGVEISFYLAAPLFARNRKVIIGLLPVAYLCHYWIATHLPPHHPISRYGTLNFFWLFLLGISMYWLWKCWHPWLDKLRFPSIFISLVSVAITWAILAGAQPRIGTPILFDVFYILFAFLVIIIFNYTRHARIDSLIGELSYPLYLIHWPIVAYLLAPHRGDPFWAILGTILSLAAALVLHIIFERPIDRYRKRFIKQSRHQI